MSAKFTKWFTRMGENLNPEKVPVTTALYKKLKSTKVDTDFVVDMFLSGYLNENVKTFKRSKFWFEMCGRALNSIIEAEMMPACKMAPGSLLESSPREGSFGADLLSAELIPDMVNHPSHYTAGKIECIEAIESATGYLQGLEAVCTGAAIKYLWRWKLKNGVEDLKKAVWYINKMIDSSNK